MDVIFDAMEDMFSDAFKMAVTDLTDGQPAKSDLYRMLHAMLDDVLKDARIGGVLSKIPSASIFKDENIEKCTTVMTNPF